MTSGLQKAKNHFFSKVLVGAILPMGILFTGCLTGNDDDSGKKSIPASYSEFSNVSFSGQVERMDMLAEMTAYMKTGNEGAQLDANWLKNMYSNSLSPFNDPDLISSTKQLKNKTFPGMETQFEEWMDSIASASVAGAAGQTASNGQAGILTSNDGKKKYLVGPNGQEYVQLIEKGLMGAVFYYQGTGVYLDKDNKLAPDVDNDSVTEGKGTDLQHHWDEGFGYFAGDVKFPEEGTDRFWGKYSNGRDDLLNTNQKALQAFIWGRHAIGQKDRETMIEAAEEARAAWEDVVAGTAIHYINGAKADFADDALRNHQLSEAWAFIDALRYNPSRTITPEKVDELLALIGDNFYNVTVENLNQARDELSQAYGMEDVKDQL